MLETALSFLAPHHCYICRKPPHLLCLDCDKNNTYSPDSHDRIGFIYQSKEVSVQYVGYREGWLKDIIDGYKFKREKAAYKILAQLLSRTFPLTGAFIVTTVPTRSHNVRARGYDHMKLIAKRYALINKVEYAPLLCGNRQYSQHQKNFIDRQRLTKGAFSVRRGSNIRKDQPIVLVDDILTTGATMKEAYSTLLQAGFTNVQCLVVAYQPFRID